VVKTYQTTTHVAEALLRLTEAYTALGLDDEARRTAAVLGFNFPGSEWYADAYRLVGGRTADAGANLF
jgi:outer membrane protein assembly factor BamD